MTTHADTADTPDAAAGTSSGYGAPAPTLTPLPLHQPLPKPVRFVLVRDRDGVRHAVAPRAVAALCDTEDGGCSLLLPGGRTLLLDEALDTVLPLFA